MIIVSVIKVFLECVLSQKLITFLYFPEKSLCFLLFLSDKGVLPKPVWLNDTASAWGLKGPGFDSSQGMYIGCGHIPSKGCARGS